MDQGLDKNILMFPAIQHHLPASYMTIISPDTCLAGSTFPIAVRAPVGPAMMAEAEALPA